MITDWNPLHKHSCFVYPHFPSQSLDLKNFDYPYIHLLFICKVLCLDTAVLVHYYSISFPQGWSWSWVQTITCNLGNILYKWDVSNNCKWSTKTTFKKQVKQIIRWSAKEEASHVQPKWIDEDLIANHDQQLWSALSPLLPYHFTQD